jgi:hypothetical protein
MNPFNRDLYKIIAHKRYNMNNWFPPDADTNLAVAGNQGWGKVMHRFTIDCGVAKTLKFPDQYLFPSNDWVGIGFYVINTDGSLDPPTTARATVVMDAKLSFTDS